MKAKLFLGFLLTVSLVFAVSRFLVPATPLTAVGAYKDFAHLWVGCLIGASCMGMGWLPTGFKYELYEPSAGPRRGLSLMCLGLALALSFGIELPAVVIGFFR